MEAEYLAIAHATKHAIWTRSLLAELGIVEEGPMTIHADNQAAISFSKDNSDPNRTKHIDIRHHFVRDHINHGTLEIIYTHTDDNLADLFTKALPEDKHKVLSRSLGLGCA
jgi:prolyl oligopeptidase PreP (S9A serine peptidase family)